eukprot:gene12367-6035_t
MATEEGEILKLPDELISTIFSFLNPQDVYISMTVSHKFYEFMNQNSIWEEIYKSYDPKLIAQENNVTNWKKTFHNTPKWFKNKEIWFQSCSCSWYGNCHPKNLLNRKYEYDMNGKGFNGSHSFSIIFNFQKKVEINGFAIYNLGDTTHDVKEFTLEMKKKGVWKPISNSLYCEPGTKEQQIFSDLNGEGFELKFIVKSVHSMYQAVIREVEFFGKFL